MSYDSLATCPGCGKYGRTNANNHCRRCAETALHPAVALNPAVAHQYVTAQSNTGTSESPTEIMLPAQIDRGLAALLLGRRDIA